MRAAILVLLATNWTSLAAEKAHFDGTWIPRPALCEFWRPVRDSWWKIGVGTASPLISRHCEQFARSHTPEATVPEMIADLRAYQSEAHWFVYLAVMRHWPKNKVLHILRPYEQSSDAEVAHIANEFAADVVATE
jgi:hypothetical protein